MNGGRRSWADGDRDRRPPHRAGGGSPPGRTARITLGAAGCTYDRGIELRRHIHVLSRFRYLVAAGVLAGVVLAVLALFRPGLSGGPSLTWRSPETFTSTSRLLITQKGFPEGRATFDERGAARDGGGRQVFAPPDRLAGLAVMYSYLLMSEQVRALMPGNPAADQVAASVITTGASASALPLIEVSTTADSARGAQAVNRDATRALRRYLETHQVATDTPGDQRARIDVLNPAQPGVSEGRSSTGAIIAFLLTVMAAVSLAYVLENLRPSWKADPRELEALVERWPSTVAQPSRGDRPT